MPEGPQPKVLPKKYLKTASLLIHPAIRPRRRLILRLLHVHLKSLPVPLILPVRHLIPHAVQKRPAPQIKPPNQHPAQVAQMADTITARPYCPKEFNCTHNRYKRPHRDCQRQWKKPDTPIGKQNRISNQNSEYRSGGAYCWRVCRPVPPQQRHYFHQDRQDSRAHSADIKIIEEPLFSPHQFQFPPEHPQHQHVDQKMPQPAVKENVGDRLPHPQAGYWAKRYKTEVIIDPDPRWNSPDQIGECLNEKYACADQYQKFYRRRNKSAPIKSHTRREGRAHICSVRRPQPPSQKDKSRTSLLCALCVKFFLSLLILIRCQLPLSPASSARNKTATLPAVRT